MSTNQTPLEQIYNPRLHLKPSVVTTDSQPEIWFALGVAYATQSEETRTALTVTSMCDGNRQPPELHSKGYAADIRTREFSPLQTRTLFRSIYQRLFILGFDIVREPDHIHIEYDPKGDRHLTDRNA